jgi:uncharacterized protein YwgA
MAETAFPWHRLALVPVLAEKAPGGQIGRTALMKFAYFLQTLRGVPLGYRFTLYSYGPYASDVLFDLDYAETLGAVTAETENFSGGYRFKIRPSEAAAAVKGKAADFLRAHEQDIDWVLETFGRLSASDLELVSTIIYADRESAAGSLTLGELTRRVRDVKPHFTEDKILQQARRLQSMSLLQSV